MNVKKYQMFVRQVLKCKQTFSLNQGQSCHLVNARKQAQVTICHATLLP